VDIPVYRIGPGNLFVVLNDDSIKNIMLKDYLYVSSHIKSLFSRATLKCLNQYCLEDHKNILVDKNRNDEVILWVKECLHTHLLNILTKTLEALTIYTF
jgi:hypothetical protein